MVCRDNLGNVITKNKIYFPSNLQMPPRPNYYLLMKLGNSMKAETLNLNFSINNGLKNVSKTKTKNRWSTIYQGLYCP